MKFNLEDYETVETRLKRWWASDEAKDARIVTINHSTEADRAKGIWVIEARLYLTAGDQSMNLPKTTGWASEIDGGQGASQFAALENAETSAIGRCLANYALSGNKRSSREEMAKVQRQLRDWIAEANTLDDVEAVRLLWADARATGASKDILDRLAARGKELQSAGSKHQGSNRSTKASTAQG